MATRISIVIPVYNEAESLQELSDRLLAVLSATRQPFEVIMVDDGSTDGSQEIIRKFLREHQGFRLLKLSRNFGHQAALLAGLNVAKGQLIISMDADLQDPPELVPDLLEQHRKGFNIVYARRQNRKGESWMKRSTAKLFYRLMKFITQVEVPIDVGDFRLIDQKVLTALQQLPERNLFLRGQIAWLGFRSGFVDYERPARQKGQTGYSYRKMFRLALDGITSFSNWPLRMASVVGFFVSGVAFFFILIALYARFVTGDYVPGWASLIVSVLFIGGIQLISIGVIGEYISRLANDSRKRPFYIIEEDADGNS